MGGLIGESVVDHGLSEPIFRGQSGRPLRQQQLRQWSFCCFFQHRYIAFGFLEGLLLLI